MTIAIRPPKPKGNMFTYLVVYDPGKSWTRNSTLMLSDIRDLLQYDSLYIGTRFLRTDGRVFEVFGYGDRLTLREVEAK